MIKTSSSIGLIAFCAVAVAAADNMQLPYPPGPPLDNSTPPVLGHVPYFGSYPFETFAAWGQTYGPIIGIKFGKVPAVVLNDPSLIRRTLEEPVLAGRPTLPINVDRSDGQVEGVLFTEKKNWLEQRDFALHNLNTYSEYGARSLEQIVTQVAGELVDSLAKDMSTNFTATTKNRFNGPVFKILWTMFTGKSYDLDDPELADITGRINAFVRGGPPEADLLQIVPEMANYLPKEVAQTLPKYEDVLGLLRSIVDFVRKQIEDNQQQQDSPWVSSKNYVDKYLKRARETKDTGSSFYKDKGMRSLTYSLVDMIIAGSETISTTLEWAFLYLAKNPAAQAKLQQELDSVLTENDAEGRTWNRAPGLDDRDHLPYTSAVLKEVLRLSSVVPLSVFHRALEPTSIEGYKVDKDSIVIANTYGVHHDPKHWPGGDPKEFRPERFLDGGRAQEPEAFMPFGAGYRVCVGKKVAQETLFLMIARLFHQLEVKPAPSTAGGADALNIEPKVTQVLTPKDHNLVINRRARK